MHLSYDALINIHRIMPEIVLCFFGIVIMLLDPILGPRRQRALGWVAFVGVLVAVFGVHVMEHVSSADGARWARTAM